ncbi:MAG TPA: TrmH family RNA methyltransferase [Lacipirellulaceae bacterium]|nr:TrmH family RNA methyltransferase [Lacipirellulaceae bacterium]
MFATVVDNLKSPENTGIILRTHVAFGGGSFVMIGPEPWRFKKRSQSFSRRLEKVSDIVYLPDENSFFEWCRAERFTPVAIEIAKSSALLPSFQFPERPAIVVGHEAGGLSEQFLQRCSHVVTIPQFGPVGCLNAAVSCSIAIYELNRRRPLEREIKGHQFAVSPSETPNGVGPAAGGNAE